MKLEDPEESMIRWVRPIPHANGCTLVPALPCALGLRASWAPFTGRPVLSPEVTEAGTCILSCTEGTLGPSTVCRDLCFCIPSACQQRRRLLNDHCRRWHPVWRYPKRTIFFQNLYNIRFKKANCRDFSGGPVAKTLCSQRREPGSPSLVGELDPTCHN